MVFQMVRREGKSEDGGGHVTKQELCGDGTLSQCTLEPVVLFHIKTYSSIAVSLLHLSTHAIVIVFSPPAYSLDSWHADALISSCCSEHLNAGLHVCNDITQAMHMDVLADTAARSKQRNPRVLMCLFRPLQTGT